MTAADTITSVAGGLRAGTTARPSGPIVEFVGPRLRRGRLRAGAGRGAHRGLRQRRHAVVREADADPARLHPAPARRDGRGRPGAAHAPAVAGRLRARLRLAGRGPRPSTTPATTPTCECSPAASSRPSTASASRTSRRASDAFLRTRPAPDARPRLPRVRLRADARAARLPGGERVQQLHRLGRRPRLHAPDQPGGVRDPARAGDRQQHRAGATPATPAARSRTWPQLDYLDDGPQKPIRIWSRTGRRPLLAGGNSNGDVPMLEFTSAPRQADAAPARAPRRRQA